MNITIAIYSHLFINYKGLYSRPPPPPFQKKKYQQFNLISLMQLPIDIAGKVGLNINSAKCLSSFIYNRIHYSKNHAVCSAGKLFKFRTCRRRVRIRRSKVNVLEISNHIKNMATFASRVQYLDDTDPFSSTNFPEPTRPPTFTFHVNVPLINQIGGVYRLLEAPHKVSKFFSCDPQAL